MAKNYSILEISNKPIISKNLKENGMLRSIELSKIIKILIYEKHKNRGGKVPFT